MPNKTRKLTYVEVESILGHEAAVSLFEHGIPSGLDLGNPGDHYAISFIVRDAEGADPDFFNKKGKP